MFLKEYLNLKKKESADDKNHEKNTQLIKELGRIIDFVCFVALRPN